MAAGWKKTNLLTTLAHTQTRKSTGSRSNHHLKKKIGIKKKINTKEKTDNKKKICFFIYLEIKETSPVESSTGYSQQVFLSIFSRTEKGRARGDAVTPDKTINNPDEEEEEEAIRVVSPFSK